MAKSKNVKLKSYKRIIQQYKAYEKDYSKGNTLKAEKLEETYNELSKFIGKKGEVLKRQTRSKKQRKEFNELITKLKKSPYINRTKRKNIMAKAKETYANNITDKEKRNGITKEQAYKSYENFVDFNVALNRSANAKIRELLRALAYPSEQIMQMVDTQGVDNLLNFMDLVNDAINGTAKPDAVQLDTLDAKVIIDMLMDKKYTSIEDFDILIEEQLQKKAEYQGLQDRYEINGTEVFESLTGEQVGYVTPEGKVYNMDGTFWANIEDI